MAVLTKQIQSGKATRVRTSVEGARSIGKIRSSLNLLLADIFTLYFKTKSFRWHLSDAPRQEYLLLLDEHGEQLLAITDDVAERVRNLGGTTIRSIGEIARVQRLRDNDTELVTAKDMMDELRKDEKRLASAMKTLHSLCDVSGDLATANLLKSCIEDSQLRGWFLFESIRA
jgi:starvation-inducible DNA-binding protein